MKKIVLILLMVGVALLGVILLLSLKKKVMEEITIYTIPREYSYWYQENRKMRFYLYVNQRDAILDMTDQNDYQLVTEQMEYLLQNVSVYKEENSEVEGTLFYEYCIECDLPYDFKKKALKDVYLIIHNDHYSCNCLIGNITVYDDVALELKFSDLYGHYAYIEDELFLVGLTICLNEEYHFLNEVRIGNAYADKRLIETDYIKDSELKATDLKHTIIAEPEEECAYSLDAVSNYYFIPISYPVLYLITDAAVCFRIDGTDYMIDQFIYLANTIYLKQYATSRIRGELIYA